VGTSFTSFSILPPPPPPPPPPAPPKAAAPPPPPPPPPVAIEPPAPPPPPPPAAVAVADPPVQVERPERPARVEREERLGRAEPAELLEAAPEEGPAPPPNMFVAALRRWPWLLVGVAAGLVVGFLVFMQRPPVYQSSAQLLVIKNRAESSPMLSGVADPRVAMVEDYVATQVTLLKSHRILSLTATSMLDVERPTSVPPPHEIDARVGFLATRFAVIREREPGSNALSNVLSLSFRTGDAGDASKCLQAIIKAYQQELQTLYTAASDEQLQKLESDLKALEKAHNQEVTRMQEAERDMRTISQEELVSIRHRITQTRTEELDLETKLLVAEQDMKLIERARGATRQERLQVMAQLGVKPDREYVSGDMNARTPEEFRLMLQLQASDLGRRLGPDHSDMRALGERIRQIEGLIEKQKAETLGADELERYRYRREVERDSFAERLQRLKAMIATDEGKANQMSGFQMKIDYARELLKGLQKQIQDKQLERDQVFSTRMSGGYKAQAITPPSPGLQVAPVLSQYLLLGAVLGLMLGGGLALLAEMSDRSFRSPDEIRRRLGVQVLGHVPRVQTDLPPTRPSQAGLDPILVAALRPISPESEAYRVIRTKLYFSTRGRDHQVIQVTSPGPGDGKSTLAANLAISIAQSGKRVVLVDCDFRKPRVHKLFKLPSPEVGLASVMAGDAKLSAAVRPSEVENLSLLPCGPRPANPAELLTSPMFQELLDDLRADFEFVIVDTPPVLAVSDPAAVAPRVDGVVLVLRMTKSARPAAERAREQLAAVGARMFGVVVNASAERSSGYGGYGYSYQYADYSDGQYGEPVEPAALPPKG
jgi:succinoglycan biosynthesis transport protein ExoP